MKWIKIVFLVAVVVMTLVGCGINTRQAGYRDFVEVSRHEVAKNPQMKKGAQVFFVNQYLCTSAIYRIYRGYLSEEQAIGNVNGSVAFFDDYVVKFELNNALKYNMANPASLPNTKVLILDPNTTYTVVVDVKAGAFGKRYCRPRVFRIYPNEMLATAHWTDAWNRGVYANKIIYAPGSNTPAHDNLDLTFTVFPNEIFRKAVANMMGR